ncbi:MAG: response regulator transcription factor, partial [Nitrospira sp.]
MPAKTKSSPIRLLIVDDHEVVRIGLGAVLNLTPGMKVVGQARSKADAIAQCRRTKTDVVLLDIRLPDGSGIDAAREILAAHPSIRILFLTSFADEHTVLEAILSGAQGYVLKDIASAALIRAIKTVAAGQPLIDPRLAPQTLSWMKHLPTGQPSAKRSLLSPQEQRILPHVAG